MLIRFVFLVFGLLAIMVPINTVATAHADVMRCTVTVVDGQTYLDDCDYYTDSEEN